MTSSSTRRLDDKNLKRTELRLTSVEALGSLSTDQIDRGLPATVLGEYHLSDGSERVRCALCPTQTPHFHGFIVQFQPEQRFAIGSTCGPKHLGLSFGLAQRAHTDLLNRQRYLLKIDTYLRNAPAVKDVIGKILFSDALRAIETASSAFAAAAPNANNALRSRILLDGALSEIQQVRDVAAEQRRDERLKDDHDHDPIYTRIEVRIGTLQGAGLIRGGSIRTRLFGLSQALGRLENKVGGGTEDLPTRELRAALDAVDAANELAKAALDDARNSHQFFSEDNLIVLNRWSASVKVEVISRTTGGDILVRPKNDRSVRVASLVPVLLPALPRLDASDLDVAPMETKKAG